MRGIRRTGAAVLCAFLLSATGQLARALDNGLILQERTGQTQVDRFTSLSAWFAQGEFIPGACAQPRLDGRPLPQWQCDAKTWWRDARSPELAIASVVNPASITCTNTAPCPTPYVRVLVPGHGFFDGERVSIRGAGESSRLNGEWSVIDRDDDGFSLAGLGVAGDYNGGAVAVGPANGSLRHAIISFRATLNANASHKVDFVASSGACHLGDRAACEGAALTRNQMLAFNETSAGAGNGWGASMETGAAGILKPGAGPPSVTVSARDILARWDGVESECGVRYWLRGPVVTQVIAEDRCYAQPPQYDFGWRYVRSTTVYTAQGGVANATQLTIPIPKNGAADWNFAAPVLVHLRRSTSINELVRVCGIDTSNSDFDTLRVCEGGRGAFGTTAAAFNLAGLGVSAIQADNPAPAHRQLHPYFILTFPQGWAGVKVDYIMENASLSRLGGAWISWTLRSGGGLDAVRFKSGLNPAQFAAQPAQEFWMNSAARMRKTFWDGRDPDHFCSAGSGDDPCLTGVRALRVRTDHNQAYKVHARLLPPMDLGAVFPSGRGSAFEQEWQAFQNGDRGNIGASRSFPHPGFPATNWRILGLANYNQYWDNARNGSAPNRDNFNGPQEEGGILPRRLAKFVASWGASDYGWEILFGTSVPGGGGLAAVMAHIPVHLRETDAAPATNKGAAPYTASTGDATAFGRPVSLDVRPSIYFNPGGNRIATQGDTQDRPTFVCDPTLPNAWCYHEASMDNFVLDQAHQHQYAQIAYAITGDYYWLEELQFWAAANLIWKNPLTISPALIPVSAMRHRHWGYQAPRDIIRQLTWPVYSILEAAIHTPNTPQFGSRRMPELHYLMAKLAKNFQIEEGRFGIRNGHYPWVNPSCEGVNVATTNDPSCWGFLDQAKGWENNLPVPAYGEALRNEPEMDSSKLRAATTVALVLYYYALLDRMEGYGIWQGGYVYRKLARYGLGRVLNKFANPYHLAAFREGTAVAGPSCAIGCPEGNPIIQTFEEMTSTYSEKFRNATSFQEFGPNRELLGIGYVYYWRSALALLAGAGFFDNASPGCTPEESPPDGCSGTRAFAWILKNMRFQDMLHTEPKWNYVPHYWVRDVSVSNTLTSAEVRYSAPTADACTYYFGPEPPSSSLDTGEPRDSGGDRTRVLQFRDLRPQTTYYVRLTCGPRNSQVSGAGRMLLAFETREAQAARIFGAHASIRSTAIPERPPQPGRRPKAGLWNWPSHELADLLPASLAPAPVFLGAGSLAAAAALGWLVLGRRHRKHPDDPRSRPSG